MRCTGSPSSSSHSQITPSSIRSSMSSSVKDSRDAVRARRDRPARRPPTRSRGTTRDRARRPSRVGRPQPTGRRRRHHQVAELEQPQVLVHDGLATGRAGRTPRRSTRAAGSAPFTPPTSSPRSCSARASSTAASSGIGSTYSGYGANGAVRIATPTTLPRSSRATAHQRYGEVGVPLDRLLRHPRGHGRDHRRQHRVGRQVRAGLGEEGGGIVGELEGGGHGEKSASPGRRHNRFLRRARARPRISSMTETQSQATDTTSADRRAVVVPEKPALEGLEATWSERWKARGHLRVRPHPAARERLLDRHPAADRERQPARRARVLLHPHRPDRPLPADARQVRLLPDGLGRQRPADRAPGAELLRRPLRPVAAVRRGLHAAGEAGPEEADPDQPAELHRALRAAGRAGRGGLRAALAHPRPLGRLEAALHDDRRQVADRQPARVPAQLRPRRGLPPGRADAVGRHVPDRGRPGRARGPRVRRRLPPGRVPQARRLAPSSSRRPVPS